MKNENSKLIPNKLFLLFLCLSVFSILGLSLSAATVAVVAPASNSNLSTSALFNVSFATTDISNALNASFYYNLSGTWTLIGTISNATADPTAIYGTLSIASLTNGVYTINATVRNATDSATASTLKTIVLFDSTKPAVTLTLPNGDVVSRADSVQTSASVTDTSTLTYSTVMRDTSSNAVIKTITGLNPTFTSPDTDTPGSYSINLTVTDAAGNVGSATKTIQIISNAKVTSVKNQVTQQVGTNIVENKRTNKIIIAGVIVFVVLIVFILMVMTGTQKKKRR